MKCFARQTALAIIVLVPLASGCSKETAKNAPKAIPAEDEQQAVASLPPDTPDSQAAVAQTPGTPSDGTWVMAPEFQPPLEVQPGDAGDRLTGVDGVFRVRMPRGTPDQLVIWNQPLDDDYEITVKLRWPDWETSSGSPDLKFGLCNEQGRMQKFAYKAWFKREPKEFYEFRLRCSGGGVGLRFNGGNERAFPREFDGKSFFAFEVDAPSTFEIVEQSVVPGTHEIKFAETRRGMPPPNFGGPGPFPGMPPGMPPGAPPGMMPGFVGGRPGGAAPSGRQPTTPQATAFSSGQVPHPTAGPIPTATSPWRVFGSEIRSGDISASAGCVRREGELYRVVKTPAVPDVWLLRELPKGDGEASITFHLPTIAQLRSQPVPAMLGIGIFSSTFKDGIRFVAPSPDPTQPRKVKLSLRRDAGKVEYQVDDGERLSIDVRPTDGVEVGFWVAGMLSFQFEPLQWQATPRKESPVETTLDGNAATREWTDATGKFKVRATFVRLDGTTVILKKEDGKLAQVPLERLAAEDRKIAKQLAGQ